jgi:hypothetical protein
MTYLWNVLEAFSQLLNTILLGSPNMSLSARAYIKRNTHPKPYKWINKLFFWQEDHCKQSWESDVVFAKKLLSDLTKE